jgi:ABC-type branched-subunit amino acid transport system substrate-binding protein
MRYLPFLMAVASIAALTLAACGGDGGGAGIPTATVVGTVTSARATASTPTNAWIPEDGDILLGSHFPQSGTYGAAFSAALGGMKAYFEYVNEELGGVCGRRIVFRAEDDGHDPAKAIEVTRKLLEQDKVLAMVGALGDATHSAVVEYLNEKGVPDLWAMSGVHEWAGQPQQYPWSVTVLDYFVEGAIMGRYISDEFPGKKVGVLYQNDAFGRDGLAGVEHGLDAGANEIVSRQSYELEGISIRDQVVSLKEDGAEVVALYAIPGFIDQAIVGANHLGWHPQFVASSVYLYHTYFIEPPDPRLMEGLISFAAFKPVTSKDDPAIAGHYQIMRDYSGPSPDAHSLYGQAVAELTVEVLSRTCDNLTRQGLMDTVESLRDYRSDLLLDGVTVTMSETDHLAIEQMTPVKVMEVGGKHKWEYVGSPLSFR